MFAKNGCNIFACIRKENAEFQAYLQTLERESSVWIKPVYMDLENEDSVKAAIKAIMAESVRIDILVNNAGAKAGKDRVPVVDLDESDWDNVHRINTKGTFLCSRAVARTMLAARQSTGRIINISSTAGKTGRATYAAYSSSKFAVIGFTQCLAQELHYTKVANALTRFVVQPIFEAICSASSMILWHSNGVKIGFLVVWSKCPVSNGIIDS
jgi:NAD(P)-dependent dehydrogenase (short-subunit alcohol dehydrogenase family)